MQLLLSVLAAQVVLLLLALVIMEHLVEQQILTQFTFLQVAPQVQVDLLRLVYKEDLVFVLADIKFKAGTLPLLVAVLVAQAVQVALQVAI
jgi:hypothetical protein